MLKNSELNEKVVFPYAKRNIALFYLRKIFCLCELSGGETLKDLSLRVSF